jgi:hypothetical protein
LTNNCSGTTCPPGYFALPSCDPQRCVFYCRCVAKSG